LFKGCAKSVAHLLPWDRKAIDDTYKSTMEKLLINPWGNICFTTTTLSKQRDRQ
jgi:hypothetical protein